MRGVCGGGAWARDIHVDIDAGECADGRPPKGENVKGLRSGRGGGVINGHNVSCGDKWNILMAPFPQLEVMDVRVKQARGAT